MENENLYPELMDYIFTYCGKYFWSKQKISNVHPTLKNIDGANVAMYKILTQGGDILKDKEISELTNDGYEAYKRRITELIFNYHRHELHLNLCPKCFKIARTPLAKQCRFCFYSWH